MMLLDCIKQVPTFLHNFYSNRAEILESYRALSPELPPADLIIVGSGSSYNAALAVNHLITRYSTIHPTIITPGQFIALDYKNDDPANKLYIFISQGGNSKLVHECLLSANALDGFTVALSDNPNGKISMEAKRFVPLGIGGEPYLFRTIGFDASALVLLFYCLIALKVNKNIIDNLFEELHDAENPVKDSIQTAELFFKENYSDLSTKKKLLVHRGCSFIRSRCRVANKVCRNDSDFSSSF